MDFNLEQARFEQEIGRSWDLTKLNEALCNAQQEMNVDTDGKGNRGNKYVTIKEMINATQSTLIQNGLILSHVFNKIDGDTVLDAILHHRASNQWIRSRIPLVIFQGATANETGQGVGCIITYFRRYTYSSILGLRVDEPDLEDANAPMSQEKSDYISDKQFAKLKALLRGNVESEKKICVHYGIDNLSHLPWKHMNSLVERLEKGNSGN